MALGCSNARSGAGRGGRTLVHIQGFPSRKERSVDAGPAYSQGRSSFSRSAARMCVARVDASRRRRGEFNGHLAIARAPAVALSQSHACDHAYPAARRSHSGPVERTAGYRNARLSARPSRTRYLNRALSPKRSPAGVAAGRRMRSSVETRGFAHRGGLARLGAKNAARSKRNSPELRSGVKSAMACAALTSVRLTGRCLARSSRRGYAARCRTACSVLGEGGRWCLSPAAMRGG